MERAQNIGSYTVSKKLGESIHAEVFKVHRPDEHNRFLVVKRIQKRTTSHPITPSLKQHMEYLKHVRVPGVIIPEFDGNCTDPPLLIQEYFDGVNLDQWRKSREDIALGDFFKVVGTIVNILNDIHNAGHVHGGIKPNNILIAPDTLDIRLIDIVRVIDIREISYFIHNDDFRRNTLNYISPEQTGRIKQRVDYTTDYYSLGIVFYEILSGETPFSSTDPLEIIHSHLAEDPIRLCEVNREVPEILSDIVTRLMQKEPEKRYQTGQGLLHDLRVCQEEYLQTGKIVPFTLGLKDYTQRITTPSIIVGREQEKKFLLKEHADSIAGSFRAALISGPPGIGKTRLVQELQIPTVTSRGYFTSGKYNWYQKNIPYSTLIQAFRNLMYTYLSEDTERIEYWKDTISKALEPNGRLITDFITELEFIIGPQPEVPPLPPTEARNRFHRTVARFISCLAKQDHPLTLFIDDLQWCDSASFDIIEHIFTHPEDHAFLFFLGAYRHNEVDKDHPLSHLLEKIKKQGKPPLEMRLENLKPAHCNEIVSYMLNSPPSRTENLSKIIDAASEGNPLHINESLSWFHDGNLLYLKEDGIWQWDEERIGKSEIPESTVKLFVDKMKRLQETTLELIEIAACLGTDFKAEDLSMITDKSVEDVYRDLSVAFREEILIRGGEHIYFFHDRVQEAVYSTIDKERRRAIHGHIAEAYIRIIPEDIHLETLGNLFEITEHMNRGRGTASDTHLLYRDAGFNYHAGSKAMGSLALEAANRYFRQSMSLLTEDIWDIDYEFAFSLYKDLARSELTQGKQEEAEKLLNILLERATTDIDRAECLMEKAAALVSLVDSQKTIDTANQALAYLGMSIPEDLEELSTKIEEYRKKLAEQNIDIREIAERPLLEDRRTIIELRLYNLILPSYYLLGIQYPFVLGIYQSIHLVQQATGVNDMCTYMIVAYSIQLLFQGNYEQGFTYADQAERLFQRFPNTEGTTRAMSAMVWVGEHWRSSLPQVIKKCQTIIENSKNLGDIYRAGQGYSMQIWASLLQGKDLKGIEDRVHECLQYSQEYSLPFSRDLAGGIIATWVEPMMNLKEQTSVKDKIAEWEASKNYALLGSYYVHKAAADYYFGNYEQADIDLRYSESFHGKGNISHFEWHVYYVLNSLRLLEREQDETLKQSILERLSPPLKMIELWSGFGPAIRPFYAFIRAEIMKSEGKFKEARALSLDAIDIAHEYEYTLLEGHMNELLGAYLISEGYSTGSAYIKEAAYLYEKCHAHRKLSLVKEKHPQYFSTEDFRDKKEYPLSKKLDTAYLMKAARAISRELDLSELLKTIMQSVMEGLGAQESYLLTVHDETLIIRAQGTKGKTLQVDLMEEPLNRVRGLSRAIIRYVQRTKETVILENAMEEGPFVNDKEVQKFKLRSVLCQPMMQQKKLVGIVYLQNSLMKSVFTEEQVELTRLLTSHAAVALENAVLVDEMKKAEKALRKSEEEYRNLVEQANDGIVIVQDTLFRYVNRHMAEIVGYTVDEMVDTIFIDYIHPDEAASAFNRYTRRMAGENITAISESAMKHKDGRKIHVEVNARITSYDGKSADLVIIRDITERKRAEEELKKYRDHLEELVKERTSQLEAAQEELLRNERLATLGKLTATVSHEIRNPLGTIRSSLYLINRRSRDKRLGIKPFLDRAERSVIRCDKIIDELMDYTRTRNLDLEMTVIDEWLKDVLDDQNLPEGIVFTKKLKSHAKMSLDRERFRRCIVNVIDNAHQALAEKIDEKPCKGQGTQENILYIETVSLDHGLEVRITDTGPGIPSHEMDKVFEPLYSTRGFGVGLGLTTVKQIMEQHGGGVDLESEVGRGTKVTLWLPTGE